MPGLCYKLAGPKAFNEALVRVLLMMIPSLVAIGTFQIINKLNLDYHVKVVIDW